MINKFVPFREKTFCSTCSAAHDTIRYNPFFEIVNNSDSQESDKFYETEPSEYTVENLEEQK